MKLQPAAKANNFQIEALTVRMIQMEWRMEDLEWRNGRSNIWLIGLQENVEGTDMVVFLEKWLREEVVMDGLSPFFALERAHRVPAR